MDAAELTTVSMLDDNNLFAYCGDNPTNREDNNGQCWHIVVGAAVGFAFGFISNAIDTYNETGEINVNSALAAGAFGAVGGALTAAGLPTLLSIGASAVVSAAAEATDQVIRYTKITDPTAIIKEGIAGGVSGAFSGNGAMKDLHINKYVNSQLSMLKKAAQTNNKPLWNAFLYTWKMTNTCYMKAAAYAARTVAKTYAISKLVSVALDM